MHWEKHIQQQPSGTRASKRLGFLIYNLNHRRVIVHHFNTNTAHPTTESSPFVPVSVVGSVDGGDHQHTIAWLGRMCMDCKSCHRRGTTLGEARPQMSKAQVDLICRKLLMIVAIPKVSVCVVVVVVILVLACAF